MVPEEKEVWPLQVREYSYGWAISYHDAQGRVRHVLNADSEIQAFRAAHKLVRIYGLTGNALVRTRKGEFLYDIERLMHDVEEGKHR